MKAQITVVTPTYNRAHTLKRLYHSLKEQVFKDFVWVLMDDGSTDNTKELVESFIDENKIVIEYYYNSNKHKFITVFEGIKKVKTPYFVIIDSDDTWPSHSFQTLYDEVSVIENKNKYIGVIGHSADTEGNLVGDLYPEDRFTGTVFEMRYKYKVRGDKNGIFITDNYLKELKDFNYAIYEGKGYIPQSVFFNTYDGKLKTKFINKIIRTYHKDDADANSVSNTRWTGKNIFGLREGYKSFLNNYDKQLIKYPKVLFRNLVGFHLYSYLSKVSFASLFNDLNNSLFKILSLLMFPVSYLYYLIKIKK